MRKITLLLSLIPAFLITNCAPKIMILQTPIVSMTKSNSDSPKPFSEGKPIEFKWCGDEKPVQKNSDGSNHYGLIDQVIWKAHKQTKADFFVNNKFYQQGQCVFMNANLASTEAVSKATKAIKKSKK